MTKAKIQEVPKPELKSQPINAIHRQEFVIEFTRIVFQKRIVAAVPDDINNFMVDLDLQKKMLVEAFPLLNKNHDMGAVFGNREPLYNCLQFQHQTYKQILDELDSYHIQTKLFGCDIRRGDNIDGAMRVFSSGLIHALKAELPNVEASKSHYNLMHSNYYKKTQEGHQPDPDSFIYLPHHVININSLLTEKKTQKADGTIVRTPIIKKQYIEVIPKKVQTQIVAWMKKGQKEVGVEKLHSEVKTMFEFSKELYEGIKCIRNTKQFQERYPDIFDEFCSITGLGQCDGKDLICATDMGTVNTILAEYRK